MKKNNIFAGLRVKNITALAIAGGLIIGVGGIYSRHVDKAIKAENARELQKQQEIAAVREAEAMDEAAKYAIPNANKAPEIQNRGNPLSSFNRNITAMRNRIGNLPAAKIAKAAPSDEGSIQFIIDAMDADTKYYADYYRRLKPGKFVSDSEAIEELQALYDEGRLPHQQAQKQR